MAIPRTAVYLVFTAMVVNLATATNYTVGGPSGGWDMVTDQQTWASSKTFHVGDNLIFQYSPTHDVAEVAKSDYDSCQATSPIQTYSSGSTAVPLTSPGKRYFICTTTGHCSGGMKLEVVTLAAASSPAGSPEVSPPEAAAAPAPAFQPVSSPAPEAFAPPPLALAPPPVAFAPPPVAFAPPPEAIAPPPEAITPPEDASLPSPPESPIDIPSAVPDIPTTESPAAGISPLTPTSANTPDSSAEMGGFPIGLSFVILMIPGILAF